MASGQADLFITYCTNATIAAREQPTLMIVAVPAAINVSASYGVTPLAGAEPLATKFIDFVLSTPGQAILKRQGFSAP